MPTSKTKPEEHSEQSIGSAGFKIDGANGVGDTGAVEHPSEPTRSLDAGAFEIKDSLEDGEFDISPKDIANPIPEEQAELSHGIYATWGVLKRLRDKKQFEGDELKFKEFRTRLLQVAKVGLEREHVKSRLAAKALDQIRGEIALRKGLAIKMQYLTRLGAFALGMFLVGVAVTLLHKGLWVLPAQTNLLGYGFVLMGSAAGTWLSVAATRRSIAFEEMPDFVGPPLEPFLRLVFVGGISLTLALLLELNVITLQLSTLDLKSFQQTPGIALLLGVFAGLSERAVSVRITNTATGVFSPSPPAA